MTLKVKSLLRELLQQLAPDEMSKPEVSRLRKAAGLSEGTIRNAKRREGLTADTLLALFLAHGVDPKDILNIPYKKPSKVSPTNTKWYKLGIGLSERKKLYYMDFITWNESRLKSK